jgi:hypothetical protein
MTNERSKQKLMEFLDYMAETGLMAEATVAARKAAASKVLGILSAEEASDVTKLDLDQVMARFHNLEGRSYTPGSLTTYLSRLKSAVDDFKMYIGNPLGFKPSVQTRERRRSEGKKEGSTPTSSEQHPTERHAVKAPLSSSILPIPIRADITIFIQGLPYDLTDAEASKIANVIRAMATPA